MRLRATPAVAALAAALSTPAWAQQPPGTTSATAAVTGYGQFNTTLDAGGRFNWSGVIASASVSRQWTPQVSAGIVARYEYQSWNFDQPAAFGNVAPWKNFNAPSIGASISYAYAQDVILGVRPVVEWDYESGADTGEALTYGAVASVAKVFSPDLVLGLGVSVFRRIDKTQALPFFVVNWKFADKWRLANPFQAGPAGGAGVELVYTPNDAWEIAEGVAYRSYRWRLAEDAPVANGIAQNSFVPVFLRVTRRLSKDLRIDLYGALPTNGKLEANNEDGSGRYSDKYKLGPALGVSLVAQF
jgi:hypothetical protein